MSKFYFVRHGESEANASGIVAGASNPKLTLLGLDQARTAGEKLKDKNVGLIICSPMLRAQQTAEIIAGELGIAIDRVKIVDELQERGLGECNGKPKDMDNDSYINLDSERGFEPHEQLIARMSKALEIIDKTFKHSDGNLLVIGHAVSGFFLRQVAKNRSDFAEFDRYDHVENADYVEVEIKND